jgi:hypothetical protein
MTHREKKLKITVVMKKSPLKKNDYVLATKYRDGDPGDHFVVGFLKGMLGDRYLVADGSGNLFRANGFRRCEKISGDIGYLIVKNGKLLEQSCSSIWWWRYHPKRLQEFVEILSK